MFVAAPEEEGKRSVFWEDPHPAAASNAGSPKRTRCRFAFMFLCEAFPARGAQLSRFAIWMEAGPRFDHTGAKWVGGAPTARRMHRKNPALPEPSGS